MTAPRLPVSGWRNPPRPSTSLRASATRTSRIHSALRCAEHFRIYNLAMPTAKGPFEVKLAPIAAYNTDPASKIGRMSLDKTFHGDLEGNSKGEMTTAMGEVQGSGVYVAVERVTGTLHG